MRTQVFLLLAIVGCSRPNPNACCVTESQCAAIGLGDLKGCSGTRVCNSAGVCAEPECTSDIDCPAAKPHCENQLCTGGCTSSNDCAAVPGKPVCGAEGACEPCTDSSQCPATAPVCDMTSGDCTTATSMPDAPAACVPELLFQRGDLFTNGKLYRINLQDFVEHLVSIGTDTDVDGSWSPDGQHVVLSRGGSSIVIVDADGSNSHTLDAQSNQFLVGPQYSPDGQRVAYYATPFNSGSSHVFSAPISASAGTNLTPASDGEGPLEWSPDGTHIAFESNRTGNVDVFVMLADGSSQTNLTNRSGDDGVEGAHWSPDGSQLVFGANHVWIINSNGTGLMNVTGTTGTEDQPRWASDGHIYYVKSPTAGAQLFVMNATGTNQHAIEQDPAIDERPVPSPDGSMIAWVSYRDGNGEIYVANADGSNPTRVTNNSAKDTAPRWRPCPH
jgi:hypothetical protein